MKITRQGIRDLDAIGPKESRNKRTRPTVDPALCMHEWRLYPCGVCWMGDGHCGCFEECSKCGKRR